jgi:tRNA splicing endonuclease
MGMPQESRELKADDIAEYLKARDDFDLELFAYRSLKSHGWVAHHGGSYIDPLLGKRRQYAFGRGGGSK